LIRAEDAVHITMVVFQIVGSLYKVAISSLIASTGCGIRSNASNLDTSNVKRVL
jgi:hypothetical protein